MVEIINENYNNDECKPVVIDFRDNKMKLLFGGDGDLYISTVDFSESIKEKINFNITKENYYLYSLVDEVYSRIINPSVFEVDKCEEMFCDNYFELCELYDRKRKSNEYLKVTDSYKKIYNKDTGIISWYDDNYAYGEGNVLKIYPIDDSYVFEFVSGQSIDDFGTISIRFRNSGSTYKPFNIVFMDFYQKILDYDSNYHQIHIEEYLYSQKVKTLKKEVVYD